MLPLPNRSASFPPKHQGDGYGQEIEGDNKGGMFKTEVKRPHDCRQSNVDHAAVHGGQEDSGHNQGQDQPAGGIMLVGQRSSPKMKKKKARWRILHRAFVLLCD